MSHPETYEPSDAVFSQWLEAHRLGRKAECESLLESHPELATYRDRYEEVDRQFAPLRRLTNQASRPAAEIATLGASETAVVETPTVGGSFGDYDLLAEIARGGMGVVYKARQRSLNRIVALKMVLNGGRQAKNDRERFLVEARAVARLSHPHIVPIYEVGEHKNQPYFTMEFLAGGSLREKMDSLRGDPRTAARLMVTVAGAVEHAHRRGILHRDLKPGNVLLDERGEPHVTDFGLAKHLDEESDLTQAGAIVGTPSYMAPEQADGRTDLTTAADVYGLGAVLYELLTGRPPFKANTPMETMLQVMSAEPKKPRELDSKVDIDLQTICLKCLDRDPSARYGTAEALADDLNRWLAGEPILARPATRWERLVKWSRRQPVLAGSLGTTLVAGIAFLIAAGFSWRNAELRAELVQDLGKARTQFVQVDKQRTQAERDRDEAKKQSEQAQALAERQRQLAAEQQKIAERQKTLAEQGRNEVEALRAKAEEAKTQVADAQRDLAVAKKEARSTLYAADMQLAHAAWVGENIAAAADLVGRYKSVSGPDDPRGFEWFYLNRQLNGARLSWRDAPVEKAALGSIVGMSTSPDGKTLATAQIGNQVKLWNLADGKLLRTFETPKSKIEGLSFTNLTGVFFEDDGRKVTAVLRKTFDMRQMDKAVNAAMAKKEKLKIESLGEGFEFLSATLAEDKPMSIEPFDVKRLRSSVFPTMAGAFFLVDDGSILMINAIDTSPDGRYVALAGGGTKVAGGDPKKPGMINGGSIVVWDVKEGKIHARQDAPFLMTAVAFSPVGDTLAVATSDGGVGIGKLDLAQPPKVLEGHQGMVYGLKFTPDGKHLASGAMDGLVLVWDVAAAKEATRLRGHISPVARIDFSPDGKTLMSGGLDGTVKVWDWEHCGASTVLQGNETAVTSLAFNKDGSELISADMEGNLKSRRVNDWKVLRDEKQKIANALMLRVSNGGKTMTWKEGIREGLVVRNLVDGKDTKLNWPGRVPFFPTFSSDGTLLAGFDLSEQGGISIWNVTEGKQTATLNRKGSALGLAFSFDNKLLAAGMGSAVVLWDWHLNRSRTILEDEDADISTVVFSPDDRCLAAVVASKSRPGETKVRIWDLVANRVSTEFVGAGRTVRYLNFSPDGHRLITGGTSPSQRGILKLWDTTSGREVLSIPLPPADLTAVALSPDGHRLAAALTRFDLTYMISNRKSPPGEIHVWDATPQK